jgi:hypothetical protein
MARTIFGKIFDSMLVNVFGREEAAEVKKARDEIQAALRAAKDDKDSRDGNEVFIEAFDRSWVEGHPGAAQVAIVVKRALTTFEFPSLEDIKKAAEASVEAEDAGLPPEMFPWEGKACEAEATSLMREYKEALRMAPGARATFEAQVALSYGKAKASAGHQAKAEAAAAVKAAMTWCSATRRRIAELKRKNADHDLLNQVRVEEARLRGSASGARSQADEMAAALAAAMEKVFAAGAAGAGPFADGAKVGKA